MRLLLVLGLAVPLGGCVSVEPVALPDGRKGYVIECNGGIQSMAACMNRAAELCGGPYEVLNRNENTAAVGTMTNGTGSIVPARFRALEVACKA